MTVKQSATPEKIARAKAAKVSGALASYAPARPAGKSEEKTPASWGPAMRI